MTTEPDVIADVLGMLRTQLPSADDPVILFTLRDVLREFCRNARVWRTQKRAPLLDRVPDLRVSSYTAFGALAWLEDVKFLGRSLATCDFDSSQTPEYGTPREYAFAAPDKVRFTPIPQNLGPAASVTLFLTLQPQLGEDPATVLTSLPAHIFGQFDQTIREGVLGRMMGMPSKPWSNGALAVVYLRSFKAATGAARGIADRQYGSVRARWSFPAAAGAGKLRP